MIRCDKQWISTKNLSFSSIILICIPYGRPNQYRMVNNNVAFCDIDTNSDTTKAFESFLFFIEEMIEICIHRLSIQLQNQSTSSDCVLNESIMLMIRNRTLFVQSFFTRLLIWMDEFSRIENCAHRVLCHRQTFQMKDELLHKLNTPKIYVRRRIE